MLQKAHGMEDSGILSKGVQLLNSLGFDESCQLFFAVYFEHF